MLFRYKKQIEDAEEIAALNLAKFRKAQQQMEEADERTQQAEAHINRIRMERGASMLVSYGFHYVVRLHYVTKPCDVRHMTV